MIVWVIYVLVLGLNEAFHGPHVFPRLPAPLWASMDVENADAATAATAATASAAAAATAAGWRADRKQITRRKNFAIISHPDAGKTTLTEKLLLFGGAIQDAGE